MNGWDGWIVWMILAGIVIALELLTGTFYLLMISLGLMAAGLTTWITPHVPTQLSVAALVGCISTIGLHNSRWGWKAKRSEASKNPDVNIDIGNIVFVEEWREWNQDKFTARVKYRGSLWDVELLSGHPITGQFQIEEVKGLRLFVKQI